MSELAVRLLLALAPQAHHARWRPGRALHEVILPHIAAAARDVADAGAEGGRGRRLVYIVASHAAEKCVL